jgi:hypothetical protein
MMSLLEIDAHDSIKEVVVKMGHPSGAKHIHVHLKNGWVLSILSGGIGIYSEEGITFEVALLDPSDGDISYRLHDDVWSRVDKNEVYEIIKKASALPPSERFPVRI